MLLSNAARLGWDEYSSAILSQYSPFPSEIWVFTWAIYGDLL
uniref:Uncharacterized protein n=1 Tax=Ciona intestinalis TaxID=7719 RepID=H2XLF1_CIOIN